MELSCEESLIALYERNFSYKEMAAFIWKSHRIKLSENTISKRMKKLGFPSRKGRTIHSDAEIKYAIEGLLPDIPETVGYRCVTNILRRGGLHVRRKTVMEIMREADPLGVEFRRRRRILRRVYKSNGPNQIWHVDGYDKLKPFGFAIHGCIDGYSRKIMWLAVGPSNNDPKIVASYYVSCVTRNLGCPLILQTDPGTENTVMGALQCVFRHRGSDLFCGINSYRVVRSLFNQRIEAWWSMLRRRLSQWWIQFLQDLEQHGIFHRGNIIETQCIRYCFMPFLQHELAGVVEEWNCHRVSFSRAAVVPCGRPEVLHTLCENSGGINYLQNVHDSDLEWANTMCMKPTISGSLEFDEFAYDVFDRNEMTPAYNWRDAIDNYVRLLNSYWQL